MAWPLLPKFSEIAAVGFDGVKKYIWIPLAVALFWDPIQEQFLSRIRGPGVYKVYFVGDFDDPRLFYAWEGFNKIGDMQIGSVDIKTKKIDSTERAAVITSKMLAENEDTLLIVGHFDSTASADALPNYLGSRPPVPVILPAETNPNLVPPNQSDHFNPVLHLTPSDERQAEKIAEFLEDKHAHNIWAIEDSTTNKVYASYLASQFIRNMHEKELKQQSNKSKANKKQIGGSDAANGRVVLRTYGLDFPSLLELKHLDIDWIFFAGVADNCMIALRQIDSIWKNEPKKPNVILGNACVSRLLEQQGAEISETIYVSYDSSPDVFHNDGYTRLGSQAKIVLEQLVAEANDHYYELAERNLDALPYIFFRLRDFFGVHKVKDARVVLAGATQSLAQSGAPITVEKDGGKDHDVKFASDGTVTKSFHIWELVKPGNEIDDNDRRGATFVNIE